MLLAKLYSYYIIGNITFLDIIKRLVQKQSTSSHTGYLK